MSKSSVYHFVWMLLMLSIWSLHYFLKRKGKILYHMKGNCRRKSGNEHSKIWHGLNGCWCNVDMDITTILNECAQLDIGQRLFHCYGKHKFGMVLMAGCNHRWKFRCEDSRHPCIIYDYLTFTTSKLGCKLEQEESNILVQGNTLIGDNASVEAPWMATPITGNCVSYLDDS